MEGFGAFLGGVLLLAVLIGFSYWFYFARRARAQGNPEGNAKGEAMYRSLFPDLQPHFHPARLIHFVRARRARAGPAQSFSWPRPPGFDAARAEISIQAERELVRLLDGAGTVLAEFLFEMHPEGGVLRVGKGKFTVNVQDAAAPRVRYWHPDREFKWTRGSWKFDTRLAEGTIDSSDRGTSWSSDSPSSSSSARTSAAVGGIVAAGGAFDGGGASQSWDAAASSSASASDSADASSSAGGSSGESTSTRY